MELRPGMVMRPMIPMVMRDAANYSACFDDVRLGAGVTVIMSSTFSGVAIGSIDDAGVRTKAQLPRISVGKILI